MLRTLINQELLSLMMSARFLAAVVITLLLVVANTVVLIDEHKNRVASYSQQEKVHREKAVAAETYSRLELSIGALSGERESGTLRLCLANPISRPALLFSLSESS